MTEMIKQEPKMKFITYICLFLSGLLIMTLSPWSKPSFFLLIPITTLNLISTLYFIFRKNILNSFLCLISLLITCYIVLGIIFG